MSFHHIVGNDPFDVALRRGRVWRGSKARRGGVDWRAVALTAFAAVLFVAMLARP